MSEPAPDLDATFAALADPVRRRAIEVLAADPRRSGELADRLGVSRATMSKHLRVLREGGLVSQSNPDFDTRVRIYTLRTAPMHRLRQWLADTERGWTEQLDAFAEHLDRTAGGEAAESSAGDGGGDHEVGPVE